MELPAEKITKYVISKGAISEANFDYYKYGFEMGLEMITNLLFIGSFAWIVDVVHECVWFFILFIPLRACTGGYHFDTYLKCFMSSSISLSGIFIIMRWCNSNIFISVILVIVSIICVYCIGPIITYKPNAVSYQYKVIKKRMNVIIAIITVFLLINVIRMQRKLIFIIAVTMVFNSISMFLGKKHNNK